MLLNLFTGIAVDRLSAVQDPYEYEANNTVVKVAIKTSLMWVYAFAVVVVPSLLGYHNWTSTSKCAISSFPKKENLILVFIHVFLAVAIVVYNYSMLFKITSRHLRAIMALDPDTQRSARRLLLGHFKAAKTLLIVICSFSMCWLPYIICLCHHLATGHVDLNVRRVLGVPIFLNSILNPMIYALRIPGFRKEFIHMLVCGKCDRCTSSVAPENIPENIALE